MQKFQCTTREYYVNWWPQAHKLFVYSIFKPGITSSDNLHCMKQPSGPFSPLITFHHLKGSLKSQGAKHLMGEEVMKALELINFFTDRNFTMQAFDPILITSVLCKMIFFGGGDGSAGKVYFVANEFNMIFLKVNKLILFEIEHLQFN